MMCSRLLLFAALLLCLPATAAEAWELRRDRDNIRIFTRDVPGSPYHAVKAVTTLPDVRLSTLAALILDAEACPRWVDKCVESFIHEQVSPTEAYVYVHNGLPFPLRDRDVLTHVQWYQAPNTLAVTLYGTAVEGMKEKIPGRVRLTDLEIIWRFIPEPDGGVKVINQAHVHPGANFPAWLANAMLINSPFRTMKGLLREVARPQYVDAEVDFIQEPDWNHRGH